jgi:curved DNA-binding protein CbpA
MPDYYQVLGIPESATTNEIKQAYRDKAKSMHPDVNPSPDANVQFALVNEAYAILSDTNKRYFYNLKRVTGNGPGPNIRRTPAEQAEYEFWVRHAQEEARRHAEMPLENFMNSDFYKKAARVSAFIFMAAVAAGSVLILYPIVRYFTTQDAGALLGLFLTVPVGLLAIGQGLIGLQKK